jgi:paraquat-inducible protein A
VRTQRTSLSHLSACPYCDYLLASVDLPEGQTSRCPRCGAVIDKGVGNALQKSIALSSAGLILFFPAVLLPIMTFSIAGLQSTGNVIDAILGLFANDYFFVGCMVLLVSLVFPFLKLGLLFITSCSLFLRRGNRPVIILFRMYKHLSEWGMVEVYMLGILVSIIKMYQMTRIDYDAGFFCFAALVVLTVWSSAVVDEKLFWDMLGGSVEDPAGMAAGEGQDSKCAVAEGTTAREAGLVRCLDCGKLSVAVAVQKDEVQRCPRCRAILHARKTGSINKTWALVLTAGVLYLPANIYPMMRIEFMGSPDDSTILDGIIYFFNTGEFLIGAIILTASVLVPLFKIVGIIVILVSIQYNLHGWLRHKTKMFRFIEFIGRWSFLDVFVVALLGAMVRFGALTTITADSAAPFFTAVVVSTMFAALAFDPRILWDTGPLQSN